MLSSHHSVPKIAIKLGARFNELCNQMSKIDPCKDLPNLNHRRILGHTGDESMRPARRKSAAYFMWHECHALYSPPGGSARIPGFSVCFQQSWPLHYSILWFLSNEAGHANAIYDYTQTKERNIRSTRRGIVLVLGQQGRQ